VYEAADVVDAGHLPGVRGHAVLALGEDADGREALAVWRLDAAGYAVGAWVVPIEQDPGEVPQLADVVSGVHGCGVVDWSADSVTTIVDKVAHRLPVALADRLRSHALSVADLLTEVADHRRRYHERHEEYRATAPSKTLPLAWSTDLPPGEPSREVLRTGRLWGASPVAAEALNGAAELRRAIELWQDTEQVRYRRTHLRSDGEARPLPPRWLAALRAAYTA
jgi:hypothetical protein